MRHTDGEGDRASTLADIAAAILMKAAKHSNAAMGNFVRLSVLVAVAFVALGVLLVNVWSLKRRIDQLESELGEGKGAALGAYSSNAILDKKLSLAHEESTVVFYNRVPKSGSTTLMGVVYSLARRNRFHCLHVNVTKNDHYMSPSDQYKFAWNVTTWRKRLPAFYHGHIVFINFERFGAPPPLFIQLVRDPIERMVSYYYFLRNGDDYRPHLKRSKMGDTMSFDECVSTGHRDCVARNWWIQIPFFCGMSPQCKIPGSQWALDQAKRNLVEKYFVVGVTEQIPEFVAVLEATIPRFFQGASEHFLTGGQSHLRKTKKKIPPKPETVRKIKIMREWQMENELYQLAVTVFNEVKKRTIVAVESDAMEERRFVSREQRFFYEKIVGPSQP